MNKISDLEIRKIKDYYNSISKKYEERYRYPFGSFFYGSELLIILEIAKFDGKVILDIGTGTGRFIHYIKDIAKEVVGIDVSKNMVRIATTKNRTLPNVNFIIMSGNKLGFRNCVFDNVVCIGTFEYVSDFSEYFKEVNRVLKKGGDFVFTCHNSNCLLALLDRIKKMTNESSHISRHSVKHIIKEALEHNFRFIDYRSTFFIPVSILSRLINWLNILRCPTILEITIELFNGINRFFGKNRITKIFGSELIVLLQKI
jgi:ubiquinone/menaquinone biosynthesis C-methylase UbiE